MMNIVLVVVLSFFLGQAAVVGACVFVWALAQFAKDRQERWLEIQLAEVDCLLEEASQVNWSTWVEADIAS
jgi:hypothetical protein